MCSEDDTERINSFALVSYIPGRLGDFISGLRRELVTGCVAQSHVSILTPRPLPKHVSLEAVSEQVREGLSRFSSFELELPRIRVFEQTSVIFCEVGSGRDRLFEMHDALNTGHLWYKEPFDYHPHVTLAQNILNEDLPRVYTHAVQCWKGSGLEPRVLIENATFVQNTVGNLWLDLEEYELRGTAAVPVG